MPRARHIPENQREDESETEQNKDLLRAWWPLQEYPVRSHVGMEYRRRSLKRNPIMIVSL